MVLRFEWHPQKAARNLARHGVSFEEAATVFGDPLGRIAGDPRHRIETFKQAERKPKAKGEQAGLF